MRCSSSRRWCPLAGVAALGVVAFGWSLRSAAEEKRAVGPASTDGPRQLVVPASDDPATVTAATGRRLSESREAAAETVGSQRMGLSAAACCLEDGTCQMLEPEDCEAAGGTPQGEGESCTELQACCKFDGTCEMLDPVCCWDSAGVAQGEDSDCAVLTCEVGACCDVDACLIQTLDGCDALFGIYLGDGTDCSGTPCAMGVCCDLETYECTETDESSCAGAFLGYGTVCDDTICVEKTIADEALVVFEAGTPLPVVESILADLGASIIEDFGENDTYLIAVSRALGVEETVALLEADPDVEGASPHYLFEVSRHLTEPVDPDFDRQWSLKNDGQRVPNERHTENVGANGRFDVGESIYDDVDESGTVTAGDILLAGGGAAGDLVEFRWNERYRDANANGHYDMGECVYRDHEFFKNVNFGVVSPGDTRLTACLAFPAGSIVAVGNADVGNPLASFVAGKLGVIDADIDAPQAWEHGTDCSNEVVAILDTGIDSTHPDFAGNVWTNPVDVADGADNDGNGVIDDFHGANFSGHELRSARREAFVDNAPANRAFDAGETIYSDVDWNILYYRGRVYIVSTVTAPDQVLNGAPQPMGTLLRSFPGRIRHADDMAPNGVYDGGEAIYNDANNNLRVDVGEARIQGAAQAAGTRLHSFFHGYRISLPQMRLTSIYYDSDSTLSVSATDGLLAGGAHALGATLRTPPQRVRHTDPNGNRQYDPGVETVFFDRNNNRVFNAGEPRLRGVVVAAPAPLINFGRRAHNTDITDVNGHGTMVASVVGARGDNGVNLAGVCWDVQLMIVKVGTRTGSIRNRDLLAGIRYVKRSKAAGHNVRIMNLSLGGIGRWSFVEWLWFSWSGWNGILAIVASGNDGLDVDVQLPAGLNSYPCAYVPWPVDNVLCVGSSDNRDSYSRFSNTGRTSVDLIAPGEDILMLRRTADGGGVRYASGTSMAAPHVTGIAAHFWSRPGFQAHSIAQLKERLMTGLNGPVGIDHPHGVDPRFGLQNTAVTGINFDGRARMVMGDDFGDAPDLPYPTVLDPFGDGARHEDIGEEWLGFFYLEPPLNDVGPEFEAYDDLIAPQDWPDDPDLIGNLLPPMPDLDDYDDGIVLAGPLVPLLPALIWVGIDTENNLVIDHDGGRYGENNHGNNCGVHGPTDDKYVWVNGFFDWNGDGDWDDPTEHVFMVRADPSVWAASGGVFSLLFTVPPAPVPESAERWARFRLDYGENLGQSLVPPLPHSTADPTCPHIIGPLGGEARFWNDPGGLPFFAGAGAAANRYESLNTGGPADLNLTYGVAQFGEVEDYEFRGYDRGAVTLVDPDPTGTGVSATTPNVVVADDFESTVTNPITHFYIWGSWLDDAVIDPENVIFTLSIHSDIPVGPGGWSIPGDILWMHTFSPGEFHATEYSYGDEGFYDPSVPWYDPLGDTICYLYIFPVPWGEEFIQEGTLEDPVVYWLDVQAEPVDDPDAVFGWKTSFEHWNDAAVWAIGIDPPVGPWEELRYPSEHPWADESIDLAFAIFTGAFPEGDNCETDAIPIHTGDPGDPCPTLPCTFGFDNVRATTDGPDPECDTQFGSDIWFKFYTQVGECGWLTIDTCANGTYDGIISFHGLYFECGAECPTDSTHMQSCGDDTCGVGYGMPCIGDPDEVICPVATDPIYVCADDPDIPDLNRWYYIRMGGWGGDYGSGQMTISFRPDPAGCDPEVCPPACGDPPHRPLAEDCATIGSSPTCNDGVTPCSVSLQNCPPGLEPCAFTFPGTRCQNDPSVPCTTDSDCRNQSICVPPPQGEEGEPYPYDYYCYAPKTRYISIKANPDQPSGTARRIWLDYGILLGWVGEPYESGFDVHGDPYMVAEVVGEQERHYAETWPDVVHVHTCEVAHASLCADTGVHCKPNNCPGVPEELCINHRYGIQAIVAGADITNPVNYSEPLWLNTADTWGDTVGSCADNICDPPNGQAGLDDIMAAISYFMGNKDVAPMVWLDIDPSNASQCPEQIIGLGDIMAVIAGFQGAPYPGLGPMECP